MNIGGNSKFIYDFAKKDNPNIKKKYLKKKNNYGVPMDSSMNLSKLKKIIF